MATKNKATDLQKVFETFGLNPIKNGGTNYESECPFCHADDRFYINPKTGQWDCKRCAEHGNIFSFLQKIYDTSLSSTTEDQYKEIAADRQLPWRVFRANKLAFHEDTNCWMVPVRNGSDALANIRRYPAPGSKLYGIYTLTTHLYRAESIKPTGTIYVCEGEWDTLALLAFLTKIKLNPDTYSVVGVPGANTFKPTWTEKFRGRDVVLLYDHQDSAYDAMKKVKGMLEGVGATVRMIRWPDTLKDKYDVRDFVVENFSRAKPAWDIMQTYFGQDGVQNRKLPKRESVNAVIKDFRQNLEMHQNFEEAIQLTLATITAQKLPWKEDPVWLFLVGPPGCGKTLILKACDDGTESQCLFRSTLKASSLVSGWRSETDASLLPKLKDKTLLIADFTKILSQGMQEKEALYGILRPIYDGHYAHPFANNITRDYRDCWFGIVAGVTDVIHRETGEATLGDRFLKFELIRHGFDPADVIRAALDFERAYDGSRVREDSVSAFINRPLPKTLPTVPHWVDERIVGLSQLTAHLRAGVDRQGRDPVCRARGELATRLGRQLKKLSICLAINAKKTTVTKKEFSLVQQVAMDTTIGWNLELFYHINKNRRHGSTRLSLAETLQLSTSNAQRKLEDMQSLGIVINKKIKSGKAGRPEYGWYPHPRMVQLWEQAKVREFTIARIPNA